MTERRVDECRSCKAPIRWVKTRKGKNMPIDDEPDPTGRFVITGETDDGKVTVGWLSDQEAKTYTGERFISHFKTCPNASEHRR